MKIGARPMIQNNQPTNKSHEKKELQSEKESLHWISFNLKKLTKLIEETNSVLLKMAPPTHTDDFFE